MIHKPTPENLVPGRWLLKESIVRGGNCAWAGQITRVSGQRVYLIPRPDGGCYSDTREIYISIKTAVAAVDDEQEAKDIVNADFDRWKQYMRECDAAAARFRDEFLVRAGWKQEDVGAEVTA